MKSENGNYREDFPHYSGHIPYKKNEVIGMTVGATNSYIQRILSKEPPKEEVLIPTAYSDYSYYNKDYFSDTFSKDYELDEEKIYSNKSKDAETWVGSSKYKIYPQHIPGYKAHVPGIISGNIIGMSYPKTTALAIKGEYLKGFDTTPREKYKTSNTLSYSKPKMRTQDEEKHLNEEKLKSTDKGEIVNQRDIKKVYKSKIANVPTPGYAGHTSLFKKPVSYLNIENILEKEPQPEEFDNVMDSRMSESYRESLVKKKLEASTLPYISGYKGFRTGVKSGNYHGGNFIETSSYARNKYLK